MVSPKLMITPSRFAPGHDFLHTQSHEPPSWTQHRLERVDRWFLCGRPLSARFPRSHATWTGSGARGSAGRTMPGGLAAVGRTPSGQSTIAKQRRGSPAPVRHEPSTGAAIGATDGKKPVSSRDLGRGRKVTGRSPLDINRKGGSGLADGKFQQASTRSPRPTQSSRLDSAVAGISQEMPSGAVPDRRSLSSSLPNPLRMSRLASTVPPVKLIYCGVPTAIHCHGETRPYQRGCCYEPPACRDALIPRTGDILQTALRK